MTRAAPYDLVVTDERFSDDVDSEGDPVAETPTSFVVRGSFDLMTQQQRIVAERAGVKATVSSRVDIGSGVKTSHKVRLAAQATGYPPVPQELAGDWLVVSVERYRTFLRLLLDRSQT